MATILVVAESAQGKLRKGTLAAVTFARQLASRLGGNYAILVLGRSVSAVAQEAARYGAQAVHVLDHPALENYIASNYAAAVGGAAERVGADYVVAASSTFARDLLPRVAARLKAGMVSETLAIVGDAPPLRFKRPMWAGNVIATVEVKTPKAVFSVRATEFEAAAPAGGTSPIQPLDLPITPDARVRYAGFAATISERPDLTEASVIVSGGRGLKDKANFDALLNPLADLLHAAIGATRAVVDAGIAPNDLQIGQTGKVVAPNLYIGVALSGAIQHLAGMKNSKVIVAINKDPDAPIFRVATYGVVGDANEIVPLLTEEIKKRTGK